MKICHHGIRYAESFGHPVGLAQITSYGCQAQQRPGKAPPVVQTSEQAQTLDQVFNGMSLWPDLRRDPPQVLKGGTAAIQFTDLPEQPLIFQLEVFFTLEEGKP